MTLTKQLEKDFGIETAPNTHMITELWKNSPAHNSRITIGDEIISFNGILASRYDYIGSLIRQSEKEVALVLNGTKEIHARTLMKNPIKYLARENLNILQ